MRVKTQPLLQRSGWCNRSRRSSRTPIAVVALMLAFTAFATCFVWWNSTSYQDNAFARNCDVVQMQIRSALQTYLAFLRGAAGLFAASEEVSAKEFEKYVDRLRLPTISPGVQGIGYSAVLRPDTEQQILQQARTQVRPDFHLWPDHPSTERHAVLFLEPRNEENDRALGYNMHVDPIRARAMDLARDTGHGAATSAVTLKQETAEANPPAGFLVYVPVYLNGIIPETVEERRKNLEGFVYVAFRAQDFLNTSTSASRLKHLGFQVYDQVDAAQGLVLFTHPQAAGKPGRLERVTTLEWAQHRWDIRFSGDVNLGLAAPHIIVPWVGFTGLALSGFFWTVTRRITAARREAEEHAELAAQGRQLFERIAEAMPDVLFVHDLIRQRNVFINRQVATVLGYKPEEIQELGPEWAAQLVHPADKPGTLQFLRELSYLQGGEILTHEARCQHADGSYRWMFFRACVFSRTASGEVRQVLGVASDFSERRAIEEALQLASKSKDEFLAALSHELRTPLTPVLAIISGLEQDAELSPDICADLAMARRNVELEARLIDDLLDLTRVARGKLILHLEDVDLRHVIEHATASVMELREKGIRFSLEWQAEECHVRGDRSRLVQLFWNILKNAAKFTHIGGHVWLRVRNEHRDEAERPDVVIECEDEGIGIPAEILPRIFNAFEQGDSRVTRQFGGLGLGLAISKAVAELHRGELVAASEGPGRGATFTVRLPTIPGKCSPPTTVHPREMRQIAKSRSRNDAEAETETNGIHLKLLLVEDHCDTAEILAKRLRRLGLHVTHAKTVGEALQAAEEASQTPRPFDLVLSDLGLPDGTGFDLMKQLKERYAMPGIALSGFGMDADVQHSMEAGFARHLTKPVDFEILKQSIVDVHAETTAATAAGSK